MGLNKVKGEGVPGRYCHHAASHVRSLAEDLANITIALSNGYYVYMFM